MPDGVPGRTDGRCVIWLNKRLQQDERRCSLSHELVHIEFGPDGCQRPHIKHQVRDITVRRFFALADLCQHSALAQSLQELAEEL